MATDKSYRLSVLDVSPVPSGSTSTEALPAKLAECVWWLAVLARRHDIDLAAAVEAFLTDKEKTLP